VSARADFLGLFGTNKSGRWFLVSAFKYFQKNNMSSGNEPIIS
jgi:hypothetical protein